MVFSAGTRLGLYEVIALIGQGGMGEVYRARDTKLGRDVALKVLPDLFADDPERLARFQREARVVTNPAMAKGRPERRPIFPPLQIRCKRRGEGWSGRRDSNPGPPAPKAGALPGCATPRLNEPNREETVLSA